MTTRGSWRQQHGAVVTPPLLPPLLTHHLLLLLLVAVALLTVDSSFPRLSPSRQRATGDDVEAAVVAPPQ